MYPSILFTTDSPFFLQKIFTKRLFCHGAHIDLWIIVNYVIKATRKTGGSRKPQKDLIRTLPIKGRNTKKLLQISIAGAF